MDEQYQIFSDEEIQQFLESQKKPKKSRNVCACGHSMNSHREVGGQHICRPAKIFCRCSNPHPVAEVEDLRFFTFGTTGYGAEHALGKGMQKSLNSGSAVRWLNPVCEKCGAQTHQLRAISIDARDLDNPRVVKESANVNKIVCVDCLGTWTTQAE